MLYMALYGICGENRRLDLYNQSHPMPGNVIDIYDVFINYYKNVIEFNNNCYFVYYINHSLFVQIFYQQMSVIET